MLLSDRDLRGAMADGQLTIDPLDQGLIQPASIDVRLARTFRVFHTHARTHIDPAHEMPGLTELVRADHDGFVLHPGEFALGGTVEKVTLGAGLAARLEGKSSLGRLGLVVHSTAGFIDPGFDGHITLELSNVATLPIRLHVGMKVGQLCVMRLSSPALRPYGSAELGSRYQGQLGPTESRAWKDFPPA
jgi:dCTP deaminase